MRLTRKGDLALSTNAIVVLIIAVIVLGLIIAFITTSFSTIGDRFLGQVKEMPDPSAPTGSSPISFSEAIVGRPGQPFGMKISIMNKYTASGATGALPATTEVFPIVNCKKGINEYVDIGAVQVTPRAIADGKSETFIYLARLTDGASEGQILCTVQVGYTVDTVATAVPGSPKADLVMEVGK